ncbi:MAG: glucose-1-phosphate adenylyltransferase, partial [Planctomycetes bacterium]|nr:glucose-1-phosphate adenylyltransferase [Planctomycetota bacterium]
MEIENNENTQARYLEMVDPSDVVVVVLGGGRGSRLHPLTVDRAKSAVSFGGKYRLIDICLSNCIHSNLTRIFILSQFGSMSLNRHIWQTYSSEVQGRGFIETITSEPSRGSGDEFQGTAEALRQAYRYIIHHDPKYVLVLNGDQIYKMDYRKMILWHQIHEAEVTVASQYISEDEVSERTLVRVDPDLRVAEFYERPRRADKLE